MLRSCRAALLVALLSCNREPSAERGREAPESKGAPCEPLPFADDVPVAEASGAAAMTIDGRAAILVIGDSGTFGAYVLVDAITGEPFERGRLPLGDGAGDDLEGLSAEGDTIWAVTSAGWMRRWTRGDGGFALADGPYPVGEGRFVCGAHHVNCGKNYEALCLAPPGAPGCAGWLGAKADGHLWCLVGDGDRLAVDPARSIDVTRPGVLSGCDIDRRTGAIWVGTNAFDGAVYRVDGAEVTEVDRFGGFLEALAVLPDGDGVILHRYSDLSAGPSPAERWRCR